MSSHSADTPAYLDIHLHFVNGRDARFVQTDSKEAQHVLEQIHPDRVFTARPVLTIGDPASISLVPCSSVERIDFYVDPLPDWPYHNEVRDAEEITEDLFHARDRLSPELVARFELVSGAVTYLRLHFQPSRGPVTPLDASLFFSHLLSGPSLRGRMEGGVFLINPANIVRVTIYPGPSEPPTGSWNARQVEKRG